MCGNITFWLRYVYYELFFLVAALQSLKISGVRRSLFAVAPYSDSDAVIRCRNTIILLRNFGNSGESMKENAHVVFRDSAFDD